jgi:hypothetical protein
VLAPHSPGTAPATVDPTMPPRVIAPRMDQVSACRSPLWSGRLRAM